MSLRYSSRSLHRPLWIMMMQARPQYFGQLLYALILTSYLVGSSLRSTFHVWWIFEKLFARPCLLSGVYVGCHAQKSYQFYLCCLLRERDWKGKRARRDIRHIYQHLTLNQQYISEEGIQKWLRVKYLTAERDFFVSRVISDLSKIEMKCASYRAKNQYTFNTCYMEDASLGAEWMGVWNWIGELRLSRKHPQKASTLSFRKYLRN